MVRIKSSNLAKFFISLSMLFALSIIKVFGGNISRANITKSIIFTLLLLALLFDHQEKSKFVNRILFVELAMMCVAFCISTIDYVSSARELLNYSFLVGAIPIYSLLASNKWKLKDLLNQIVIVSVISYLIRLYISLYERIGGRVIFPDIALESARVNWYRNGFLRINPPCFGIIIIPITLYLIFTEKSKKKQMLYAMVILLAVVYSYLIHEARSVFAYNLIEIVFILLYRHKASKKQIILMTVFAMSVVLLVNSNFFSAFIRTFNVAYGAEAYSTKSRILSLKYYYNAWANRFVTGLGLLPEQVHYVSINTSVGEITGGLGDLGIFYTFVRFGILGIVYYIMFFYRGIKSAMENRKLDNTNMDMLCMGISISVLLTCINIDLFYSIYAYSAPFCVAIFGYSHKSYICKKKMMRISTNMVDEDSMDIEHN